MLFAHKYIIIISVIKMTLIVRRPLDVHAFTYKRHGVRNMTLIASRPAHTLPPFKGPSPSREKCL
jgi:hypothetical protein